MKKLKFWIPAVITAGLIACSTGSLPVLAGGEESAEEVLSLREVSHDGGIIDFDGEEFMQNFPSQDDYTDEDLSGAGEDEAAFEEAVLSDIKSDTSLPSSWRNETLTSVWNQGSLNLCWAYATLDSGQISQLHRGIGGTDNLYSPGHLAWSAYNGGDESWAVGRASRSWYSLGGNGRIAASTLLRWYGAASFSEYPTQSTLTLTDDERFSSISHLAGYRSYGSPNAYSLASGTAYSGDSAGLAEQIQTIKKAVMKYGSATADLLHTSYDSRTNSYYTSENRAIDHEEVIIGWDDSYVTQADEPGAFLLKDSYGPNTHEGGYDWISYYDATLKNVYTFDFEDTESGDHDYDSLFSYDGIGYGSILTGRISANVFKTDEDTVLKAVGLYIPAGGSTKITVYTGTESALTKDSEVSSAEFDAEELGFYTVPLADEVYLPAGTEFTVCCDTKNSDGVRYAYTELLSRSDSENEPAESGSYSTGGSGALLRSVTARKGESFLSRDEGVTWKDNYDTVYKVSGQYQYQGNNCIKAYGCVSKTAPSPTSAPVPTVTPAAPTASPAVSAAPTASPAVSAAPTALPTASASPTAAPSPSPTAALIPTAVPTPTASPEEELTAVYRVYNPNSGEHFFTENEDEKDHLSEIGWRYEGISWYCPETGDPIYRLYNPNAGEHFYTSDSDENDYLGTIGWRKEGIAFYSSKSGNAVYRLYNPNAVCGTHHYTLSADEQKWLVSLGWRDEGIGWYAS